MPTAIARATAAHPGLTVTLTEEEPPVSVQSLRAGEADIALTFTYAESAEGEDPDLDSTELLVDPLLAVLPAGHALAAEPSVPIAALAGEPWIAGCPRCRSNLIDVCAQRGFEPAIAYATDDNVAAQSLVAAGLGVALMPQLVLAAVRHDGIVSRPLTVAVRRTIIAKTWPDLRRVPAVAVVLDALVGAVG